METRIKRIKVFGVQLVKEKTIAYPTDTAYVPLSGPRMVWDLFKTLYGNPSKEHFVVFLLDATHKTIGINLVSVGTLTESLVHPREVFQPAILSGAVAVLVAHNHPSGDTTPSQEDIAVTRRLKEAGRILGIPVLDHIVVTECGFRSVVS